MELYKDFDNRADADQFADQMKKEGRLCWNEFIREYDPVKAIYIPNKGCFRVAYQENTDDKPERD